MGGDLALQKAIRGRLAADAGVLALVPATAILDRNERPVPVPSIVLGESVAVDEGDSIARRIVRVTHTLHVWQREAGLTGVKAIAAAVRSALHGSRLALDAGHWCADLFVESARYLRDPDGVTAHGVLAVSAVVREAG